MQRLKGIIVFFIALGCIAGYFLFDRAILNRHNFMTTRFVDKKFIGLMEDLAQGGAFRIDGQEIIIDEARLAQKRLGKKTEERIRSNIDFLYAKDGMIYFDRQSASIFNGRNEGNEVVERGMLLDRNGIVLAKTTYDEKRRRILREYPFGPALYPVTGHYSAVYGKRNLEKALDAYLSGVNHRPIYRETREAFRKVRQGDNVVLTIDSRVQKTAYRLMDGKKGAVVVLRVKTGEIIAAVSLPSFDPNIKDGETWRRAVKDILEKPYENRAFSALYPPGSTFKTIVASAWLDRKHGDAREINYSVLCTGKKNRYGISDIHAHSKVDLNRAFTGSCNQFFSEIGVMSGQDVLAYAGRFGFNKEISLVPQLKDIQYEAVASLAFAWHEKQENGYGIRTYQAIDFKRNPKIVAQGAIGQNLVTAAPLQMAMVAATIANRGVAMNPYIVKSITTAGSQRTMFMGKPVKMERVVRSETADKIKHLMEMVMISGTGKNVKKIYLEDGRHTVSPKTKNGQPVRVAGKTGTAEVGDSPPHSWFIGFAPVESPVFAVAVIAENQGLGSLTASPIAMEIMAEALNNR